MHFYTFHNRYLRHLHSSGFIGLHLSSPLPLLRPPRPPPRLGTASEDRARTRIKRRRSFIIVFRNYMLGICCVCVYARVLDADWSGELLYKKINSLFRSTFQRSADFGDVTHGSLGKIIGFILYFFCEGNARVVHETLFCGKRVLNWLVEFHTFCFGTAISREVLACSW